MTYKQYLFVGLIVVLLVAGCSPASISTATAQPVAADIVTEPPPVAPEPTTTSAPPPTSTNTAIPPTEMAQPPTPTTKPALPSLPPEAQRIEFAAEDGAALVGYYYPAAVNPAPIIVLMHWAGGDQTDWLYVGMVSWLQNRGG